MTKSKFSRLNTCLIADDDSTCAETLADALGFLGLECRTAYTGEQAWAWVRSSPPDVLITDMNMPPPNGLDLLHRCRQAGHHFFVILISARTENLKQQPISLGDCCSVVLSKPFSLRTVMECLDAADGHEHYRDCVHASAIQRVPIQARHVP